MGMFVFATGSHRHGTIMDSKLSSEPDGTYRKYSANTIPSQQGGRDAGGGCDLAFWEYGASYVCKFVGKKARNDDDNVYGRRGPGGPAYIRPRYMS